MSEEIKACIRCSRFIHVNAQCGRSRGTPDFVNGTPAKTMSAQHEREWDSDTHCGPSARFFVQIVPADYAETMIRRDQERRHTGGPEHDLDVVGRMLRAGS